MQQFNCIIYAIGEGIVVVILRVLGILITLLGLVFCITIIGAFIGVPMIFIGLIMVVVGRKPRAIIVNVHQQPPRTT